MGRHFRSMDRKQNPLVCFLPKFEAFPQDIFGCASSPSNLLPALKSSILKRTSSIQQPTSYSRVKKLDVISWLQYQLFKIRPCNKPIFPKCHLSHETYIFLRNSQRFLLFVAQVGLTVDKDSGSCGLVIKAAPGIPKPSSFFSGKG